MSRPQDQDQVVKWLTIGLTLGAFANSYRHGVQWTLDHSPADQDEFWAWVIAALPEIMIVISVRLALRSLRDPRVWVIGGYAVGWTMWVNGAAAAGGLSGSVVALSPAWSALLALWAMDHRGPSDTEEPQVNDVDQAPEPRVSDEERARRAKSKALRKTRLKAQHVEDVDRLTVFERDEWTCHICNEPVDQSLRGDDPLGPSLDHVVPLAAGGAHSYANTKLAHTGCNRAKGPAHAQRETPRSIAIEWALTQPTWPTARQILDQFPNMSRSTAKRVKPPTEQTKTAVTATDREAVNA